MFISYCLFEFILVFVNKLESVNNSKVEIYLAISAIVYVILHYLIFNKLNKYTSKYKYIFYLLVIMDIIYAHKLYKSKLIKPLKTETKAIAGTQEDNIVEYLKTLQYKSLTEAANALDKSLNTMDNTSH